MSGRPAEVEDDPVAGHSDLAAAAGALEGPHALHTGTSKALLATVEETVPQAWRG
jgi:hypothetical protein